MGSRSLVAWSRCSTRCHSLPCRRLYQTFYGWRVSRKKPAWGRAPAGRFTKVQGGARQEAAAWRDQPAVDRDDSCRRQAAVSVQSAKLPELFGADRMVMDALPLL